jgi:hypothetical protein
MGPYAGVDYPLQSRLLFYIVCTLCSSSLLRPDIVLLSPSLSSLVWGRMELGLLT